jgi:predicted dienelactone hydrolase
MRRLTLVLVLALLAPSAVLARCPQGAATGAFLEPGHYGVGVRTLSLVDTSRQTPAHENVPALSSRTLTTEVWYPTAPHAGTPLRDAPAARGRFPLVLNSHGYADFRTGEAYIAEALASRGYVVASPDFPLTNLASNPRDPLDVTNQPGDVRFVLDQVVALAKTRDAWLAGRVDRHRIAASGLSYGGLTTLLVTFHPTLRDRRIRAAVALAPASCSLDEAFYRAARPPLLLMQGTQDLLVPIEANAVRTYAEARSPRELVELEDATHTAFSGLVSAPSRSSYDATLGCPLVVAEFGANWTRLQTLDDPTNGIDVAGCSFPCQGPVPTNPPMQAARQHDLTQATVVAFLESTFRKSRPARCFVRQGLAAENPDVHVEIHSAGR